MIREPRRWASEDKEGAVFLEGERFRKFSVRVGAGLPKAFPNVSPQKDLAFELVDLTSGCEQEIAIDTGQDECWTKERQTSGAIRQWYVVLS